MILWSMSSSPSGPEDLLESKFSAERVAARGGIFEMMGLESELRCAVDVRQVIIDEYGIPGVDLESLRQMIENGRIRLYQFDLTGNHDPVEQIEKLVARAER